MTYYCANLQGGLYLDFRSGEQEWYASPCCEYRDPVKITTNVQNDFWSNPRIIGIRQENLDGSSLPQGCQVCKTVESNNNHSRRMGVNERFGTNRSHPTSIIECNIQADYTCNLACRICNPNLSTTWRNYEPTYDSKFKVRPKNDTVIDILNDSDVRELQQIQFQGGEPLLTYTHIELLQKLEGRVDLSQVSLHYNTNGTVRASDQVMKFWERFKRVELYFSLDDIGQRFEYQRWPAKWAEVEQNMLWYRDNLPHNTLLGVERTMGILNSYWAEDLDCWAEANFAHTKYTDKININYHHCFMEYSYNALTLEHIDAILKKVSDTHWVHKAVSELNPGTEKDIKTMLTHIKKHDLLRNQDFTKIYPEFTTWYSRYL